MGVAILGAMAMNVASHNARMIALRHNEEKKEKTSNPIKKVKEYVEHSKQFADWKKTVEAKVCDDAYEIKKILKGVVGVYKDPRINDNANKAFFRSIYDFLKEEKEESK